MTEISSMRGTKVNQSTSTYSITIPMEYIRALKWEKGSGIMISYNEEHQSLTLQKIESEEYYLRFIKPTMPDD